MICACVDETNTVVAVQTISDDPEAMAYAKLSAQYPYVIDIGDLFPQPAVGWTLQGNTLVGPPTGTRITKLAMLQRFTVPERIAILSYIQSNPASVPAILLQNISVATYVDLSRADTIAGINYLVSFSLITSARATAILTTPITPIEAYLP